MLELSSQTFGQEEIAAINGVLASGRVTMGRETEAFEKEFAEYIGVRYAVMVNSGSSANLLVIAALVATGALAPGDRVFAPALSWSTTVWPLIQYGMDVTLIDCDLTLQIKRASLVSALGFYPEARAIVAAHIMGNPCDVNLLRTLCKKHNLLLVEDSCETLGADYLGIKTGRFGIAAAFSFYFSHPMTTIEGGMLVTEDEEVAEYARSIRSHGWARAFGNERRQEFEAASPDIDPRFLFVTEGYNLRPTELQAAMGRVQLRKLPAMNARRAEIHARMCEIVAPYKDLQLPLPTPFATPAWFAFPVICQSEKKPLIEHLEAAGVQTRPVIAGNLAKHPAFTPFIDPSDTPFANVVAKFGFYWGLHPNVSADDLAVLSKALDSYNWEQAAA